MLGYFGSIWCGLGHNVVLWNVCMFSFVTLFPDASMFIVESISVFRALRGALISNHPQLKNKHFLYFTSEDIGTPPSKLQQCTTQHAHSANSNFLKSTPVKELWNIAFLYILL